MPCPPRPGSAAAIAVAIVGPRHARLDQSVDNAGGDRAFHAAGQQLVFGGELGFELEPTLLGHVGELAAMQDAHRGSRTHDGDLGGRPGEDRGRAERARVHRDVRTAVRLAGHERHPRHGRLGERVQQLRAAAYDAVPLLADAGQVAGDVDEDDERQAERVTHPHEPRGLLTRRGVEAAGEPDRVVRDDADRPATEPAKCRDEVRRPARVQLDTGARVEQLVDERVHVVGPLVVVRQVHAEVDIAHGRDIELARPAEQRSDPARSVERFPLGSPHDVHQATAPAMRLRAHRGGACRRPRR